MEIRKSTISDFIDLQRLLKQLTYVGNPNINNIPTSIYDNIYVIVDEQKNVLGCATLLIEYKIIHDGSKVGHIEDVVIDENYRGFGLGKMLINHLIDVSKQAGCYKVLLDCDENKTRFYGTLGFQPRAVCMRLDL